MCSKETLNRILSKTINKFQDIFKDALRDVILYGSYARGDYDEESDIDIVALVV
jgi:predicted nucleotidyltransferase